MKKDKVSKIVTTTVADRPARKLLLLRSKKAICYDTFCAEVGCEWHGILNSVPEKFDTCAIITLPPYLVKERTSDIAGGVEVPYDYAEGLPQGYELIDLPACKMMYFQGMPFENERDYGEAIGTVWSAKSSYKPELYGYQYAYDAAPQFNFGAEAATGAKIAVPVVCCKKDV
ncbi:MAG: hypothetical protein FWF05_07595 [Oscillospiraceae bacterium]|nr:hypothetical protein [Oscillospiraceae bacterium]